MINLHYKRKLFSLLMLMIPIGLFGITGYEIAEQMDVKKKPSDMKSDMTMLLINKKDKTRISSLRSITKNGGEKQIVWFLSPKDDKGVAFLKIEHDDKDDEMRMWLPAFKKVRRISSKKRSDSFMGSDMSYEDMTIRELDEYTYKLLREETLERQNYYVLEIIPNPNLQTEYSKHIAWITKDHLLPIKEESYDNSGNLLKEKSIEFVKIKDYHTMEKITVKNVQKNHRTILTFENIELDTGVQDKLFQEKNLKRMPR